MELKEIIRTSIEEVSTEYLLVSLGDLPFLFEKEEVEYVVGVYKLRRIPATPYFFPGVIFQRGMILPVFNVTEFLTGNYKEAKKNSKVMVLNSARRKCGIFIDDVPLIVEARVSDMIKFEKKMGFFKYGIKINDNLVKCVDVEALLETIEKNIK